MFEFRFIRSGARTRTLNNWTRTSCVANYTTPEGLGNLIGPYFSTARSVMSDDRCRGPFTEQVVPDDAPDTNLQGLFEIEPPEFVLDGRRVANRRGIRNESLGRRDRHRSVLV